MADQVESFLDEPRQFIKESQLLLNRCTKPDRKGTATTTLSFDYSPTDMTYYARIHQGGSSSLNGFLCYGLYWFLCQGEW
jgi:hypothetical protein